MPTKTIPGREHTTLVKLLLMSILISQGCLIAQPSNHCTTLLPLAGKVNSRYNVNGPGCRAVCLLYCPVIRRCSILSCSLPGTSTPAFVIFSRSDFVQPSCQNIGCELSAPEPSAILLQPGMSNIQ